MGSPLSHHLPPATFHRLIGSLRCLESHHRVPFQLLIDHLLSEFPDVFGFPQVVTTAKTGPTNLSPDAGRNSTPSAHRSSDDPVPRVEILDPEPIRVSREEFDAQDKAGDFLVKYDDKFTHPLVTNSYGITNQALEEVGAEGAFLDVA